MTISLGDVETTALIPVAIKANETLRKNPRAKDEIAVEMIKTLGINTKPFDKFMSHEGVIARTVMLDRMVKDFVAKNPAAVIVNLGAGFDNRFSRVDNGSIFWFDLDFPDSIEVRKKVFPKREREEMISGSVLEDSWCERALSEIKKTNSKVLFLAEGLFMYLTFEEIKKLLSVIKTNFPGGTLIAE
ncbi:MAG: class I SAM-dependent methyltransferase, partial [Treponema sp.]|nr:class I SAM-dependent methyltransferase [Treponema sp.]